MLATCFIIPFLLAPFGWIQTHVNKQLQASQSSLDYPGPNP